MPPNFLGILPIRGTQATHPRKAAVDAPCSRSNVLYVYT